MRKEFLRILKKSDLMSMDLEMSGIKDMYLQSTDLPFEHYFKTHNAANKYQIIQVGICLFTRKDPGPSPSPGLLEKLMSPLVAHPFTFYVFPQSINGKLDRDITLQSSAVEFNVGAGGVDWRKWITDSLNYFDTYDQKKVSELVKKDRFTLRPGNEYKLFHVGQEEDRDEILEKFGVWYKNKDTEVSNLGDVTDDARQKDLKSENKLFDINAKSYNVIMNVKKTILRKYKNAYIATRKNLDTESRFKTVLRVYKIGDSDKTAVQELENLRNKRKFEEVLEFSQIWADLKHYVKEREIPVVGHNSMMDFEFMIAHFEKRLNPDYIRYKRLVKEVFNSGVFDTKLLAAHIDKGRNSLGNLYEILLKESKLEYTSEFGEGFESGGSVLHSAGYDAYITGICFWQLLHRMGAEKLYTLKDKFKMFSVHHYNVDISSEDMDHANSDDVFAIRLEQAAVDRICGAESDNRIEEEVNSLICDFQKLHIELEQKKINYKDSKKRYENGKLQSKVHRSFVKFCRKRLDKEFSMFKYRLFEHERAYVLGGVYFIMIQLTKKEKVEQLKKVFEGFARVMDLNEIYKDILPVYMNNTIKKDN